MALPSHTLALSMIVKNEEAHIGTALEHVRRFADQIVIVDTGSTDRTREICAAVADEVLDFDWCDDFAQARNIGLARCTTDFILCLDADDKVSAETADRIGALMRRPRPGELDWDVLRLPYIYTRDASGKPTHTQWRERIFRNGMGLAFQYPVHECLKYVPGTRVQERDDMPVIHNKLAPSESSRERNLRILRKAVESDAYRQDPRMWRMLAVEEPPQAAMPIFHKVFADFSRAYSNSVLSGLHVACARKLMTLGNYSGAREQLLQAAEIYAGWREPYFYLAQALWYLRRYDETLDALDIAKAIPRPGPELGQFDPSLYRETTLLEWRFFALRSLGRIDDVKAVIRQALAIEPDNPRFLKRQRKWCCP
jgi:hypothetical protein